MSDWKFLNNTFLSIAAKSRPRAIKILRYSDNALLARAGDAFADAQYALLHPLAQVVFDEVTALDSQLGFQIGSTATLDELLDLLSPVTIRAWDLQVSIVYTPGSPSYIAILPHGHAPFQKGTIEERIAAVAALNLSLTGIVALAATKTSVNAFLGLLNAARAAQQGKISDTGTDSTDLTDGLNVAMVGMYAFLGACINQYAATPSAIIPLFDVETIQNRPQTHFVNHVNPLSSHNIAKRTLPADALMKFIVTSSQSLKIAAVDEKNDTNPTVFKLVNGLEDETFQMSDILNSPTATFIKVFNDDDTVLGQFDFEIL